MVLIANWYDLVSLHYSAALKRSASHLDKQDDFKVNWLYTVTCFGMLSWAAALFLTYSAIQQKMDLV
jgi:hypothetical protein